MDTVSVLLVSGVLVWGTVGILVGLSTLSKQQNAAENNLRRLRLGQIRNQEVHEFIQEVQPLLDRKDVDEYVFARVLRDTVHRLQAIESDISEAIEDASNQHPANLQNLLSSYEYLRSFCESYLEVWETKFGHFEEQQSESSAQETEESVEFKPERMYHTTARELKDANAKVSTARRRLVTP